MASSAAAPRQSQRLTAMTFVALTLVTLLVLTAGGSLLLSAVEKSQKRLQIANNAEYGKRFASALSMQLEHLSNEQVLEFVQASFLASPGDANRYICVMSNEGTVLCHPNEQNISFDASAIRIQDVAMNMDKPYLDWVRSDQQAGYMIGPQGDPVELINRIPVEGAPWHVLVHTRLETLREETARMQRMLLLVLVPIGVVFVLLGTGAVGLLNRRFVGQIEDNNRKLEERVRDRTRELESTVEELQQARDALLLREKMGLLGQLVAGIAHEIRNPLNAITLHADALEEDLQDPGEKRSATTIRQAAERCSLLVQNLLSFARNAPPSPARESITDIIETALGFASYDIKREEVELRTEFAEPAPQVMADRTQLEQVIINLVLNSAAALRDQPAPREVRVRTRAADATVQITVEDNGPGLPPEIEEKLFEPFHTTKAEGEGTGLGLSLCRRFVEHHGGQIRYERAPQGGAIFRIELPRAAASPATRAPTAPVAPG